MVSEKRSGPLLAETRGLPAGLMAKPNGRGPVMYWIPRGAMIRPPGRMLGAPGLRNAGRVPAGAEYSAAVNKAEIRKTKVHVGQPILAAAAFRGGSAVHHAARIDCPTSHVRSPITHH